MIFIELVDIDDALVLELVIVVLDEDRTSATIVLEARGLLLLVVVGGASIPNGIHFPSTFVKNVLMGNFCKSTIST